MKIVIDTNVLVAALRSRRGASFKLVSFLPNDKFSIAISVPLVFEYEDALKRLESNAITEQDIGDFVQKVLSCCIPAIKQYQQEHKKS